MGRQRGGGTSKGGNGMVRVPPLSEGAYSQLRAALEERAARLSQHAALTKDAETLAYINCALFWINDATLTLASIEEEPDPIDLAKWERERHDSWTLS